MIECRKYSGPCVSPICGLGGECQMKPPPDCPNPLAEIDTLRTRISELEAQLSTTLSEQIARFRTELSQARAEERERCAKVADEYAEVNLEAAGDSVLADPVLSGKSRTSEAFAKSKDLTIDGCIHSSMYHAAKNIAAALRSMT